MALGKTVGQIKREMSSLEVAGWMAYDRISPIGPERDDINQAIQSSLIANANRGKKTQPFKPADFMPFMDKPEKATDAEQMKDQMFALMKIQNKGT